MSKKYFVIVIIIFVLLMMGFQQYLIWNSPPKTEDVLLKKISELELKIDSINNKKDSVRKVIDSTHIKIITNEKHFKEKITTIIAQPDSYSESFTRQYLSNYATTRGYRIIRTSEIEQ